eukprot:TRINITY_DN105896_c0_g1_i1.p1 TRINITY_DN105896_c0_g1~~TRINITY_DN105896_c0_g1_i1.p1  ORF type:complete len:358 (-),score=70.61 TRINITY_DN105896_c0_g1_i1:8-1081(-)
MKRPAASTTSIAKKPSTGAGKGSPRGGGKHGMGKGDTKGSPGKGGGMGQGGQRMKVTVVDMGATKILDEVELNANDLVSTLIEMVEAARPGLRAHVCVNNVKVSKDLSIEESGFVDGITVTVMLTPKPLPANLTNRQGTAKLKADGSVVVCGGTGSRKVQAQLTKDVQHIYATDLAFAALKVDGTVVAWGWGSGKYQANFGGDCSLVRSQLVDVQHVYATTFAFAALKADGRVVSWGGINFEGSSIILSFKKVQDQLVDVQHIYANKYAFAALKAGGGVVSWGGDGSAWNSPTSGSITPSFLTVHAQLAVDVQHIYSTQQAFAALKADGAVVSWGSDSQEAEALARSAGNQVKPTKA